MEEDLLNLPSKRVLLEKLAKIRAEAKKIRILLRTGDQLDKVDDILSKEGVSNGKSAK